MAGSNFIVRGGADFSEMQKELEGTQKTIGNFQKNTQSAMERFQKSTQGNMKNAFGGIDKSSQAVLDKLQKDIQDGLKNITSSIEAVKKIAAYVPPKKKKHDKSETIPSDESVPTVEKFAGNVSPETKKTVEPLIDAADSASREITRLFAVAVPLTKENAEKMSGYFKSMADTVKSELEKMKESAVNNLAAIFGEEAQLYEEESNKINNLYNNQIKSINEKNDALQKSVKEEAALHGEESSEYLKALDRYVQYTEWKVKEIEKLDQSRKKDLQNLEAALSEEGRQYLQNKQNTISHYDEKIKVASEKSNEINEIIKQKIKDGSAITSEEYAKLKELQENFLQLGISNLAASAEEAKSIANIRKENLAQLAEAEVVAILQEQKKLKEEQIKSANELYDTVLADEKRKTDAVLSETDFLNTEIGRKARENRDEQIKIAEETYAGVVQALENTKPDIMKHIDETNAKIADSGKNIQDSMSDSLDKISSNIKTPLDKISESFKMVENNINETFDKIQKSAENVGNSTKKSLEKVKKGVESAGDSAKKSFEKVKKSAEITGNSIRKVFLGIGRVISGAFAVSSIKDYISESRAMYAETVQNEQKLATIMKTRMNASNQAIQGMLDFISAEQQLGVVSSTEMTAGAQELATYVQEAENLKTLIPVMNNISTQQYGMNVSATQMQQTATMLGKVMDGQLGGLSRWGYSWTEAEQRILETGTEMERAAVLAKVIKQSVGDMNYALAQTDAGRQKQLANTFSDIKTQAGAAANQIAILFLPALQKLAGWLGKVANTARQVAQLIAQVFGNTGMQIASQENLASGIDKVTDSENSLGNAVENTAKKVKKALAPFDDLNILNKNLAEEAEEAANELSSYGFADDLFTGGIQAPVEIDPKILRTLEGFLNKIKDFIDDFKVDPITAVSGAIWDIIGALTNLSGVFNLSGIKKEKLLGFSAALETLIGAFAISQGLGLSFPLSLAISSLVTSGLIDLLGKDTAITALGSAITGIATGFMTYTLTGNPALAVGVGALAGALTFFVENYTEVNLLPSILSGIAGGILAFTKLKFGGLESGLLGIASGLAAFVFLNDVGNEWEAILIGLAGGIAGLAGALQLTDFVNDAKKVAEAAGESITGIAKFVDSLDKTKMTIGMSIMGIGVALGVFVALNDLTAELTTGLGILAGVFTGLGVTITLGMGPIGWIVGAITGIGVAIASIATGLSKDALPPIKKFADDVSEETKRMVEPLIDATDMASKEITNLFATAEPITKENTERISGYFKSMADTVKSELERMKESAINNLAAIFGEEAQLYEEELRKTNKFYDEQIDTINRKNDALNDSVRQAALQYGEESAEYGKALSEYRQYSEEKIREIEKIDEARQKDIERLNSTLTEEGHIYLRNRQDTEAHYEEKKKINEDKYDEINGIIKQKLIDGEAITSEEYAKLKELQEEFLQDGIDNLSATAEEAKSIANTRKEDLLRILSEEAAATLEKQKKSKEEQIKNANELYNDMLAEERRKNGGVLSERDFLNTEIGKRAKESRDEQIKIAEETYDGVVQALKNANPEMMKEVDETHAKLKNKWQRFCDDHGWARMIDGWGKTIAGNFRKAVDGIGDWFSGIFGDKKTVDVTASYSRDSSETERGSVTLPKFASGGVLSKPTVGLMAEYAGASTNPEIVSPISTMKQAFSDVLKEHNKADKRGSLGGSFGRNQLKSEKSMEQSVEPLVNITDGIKEQWGSVAEWFGNNVAKPLKNIAGEVAAFFQITWQMAASSVILPFSESFPILYNHFTEFKDFINAVFQEIGNFFTTFFGQLKQKLFDLWNLITESSVRSAEEIKLTWGDIPRWFGEGVLDPTYKGFSNSWDNIDMRIFASKERTITTWGDVAAWFTDNVGNPIREMFGGIRGNADSKHDYGRNKRNSKTHQFFY